MRTPRAVLLRLLLLLLMQAYLACPTLGQAPAAKPTLPRVASGTVRRFEAFPSKFVAPRTVNVWLPAGYPAAGRYDVLYMHDGQALFDSTTTWNHQEWQVDETLGRLEASRAVRPTIVVAIWNNGALRHAEYYPQKPLATLNTAVRRRLHQQALKHLPLADDYLRFLTQELKPFIDKTFATRPERAHTFLMGSSMGGLISLYALCEYPQVFGGAACLSTHWIGGWGTDRAALAVSLQQYVAAHLPAPATGHRLYFDHGTTTLDSLYAPHQQAIDAILRRRGYSAANWETRVYPGADHSERAWSRRLAEPLRFLLAPRAKL